MFKCCGGGGGGGVHLRWRNILWSQKSVIWTNMLTITFCLCPQLPPTSSNIFLVFADDIGVWMQLFEGPCPDFMQFLIVLLPSLYKWTIMMKPWQSFINQSTKQGGKQEGTKWKDPRSRRQKNHLRGPTTRATSSFWTPFCHEKYIK